jgi:hypothetical protein
VFLFMPDGLHVRGLHDQCHHLIDRAIDFWREPFPVGRMTRLDGVDDEASWERAKRPREADPGGDAK